MAKYYGYGYDNSNYVGVVEITQTSQSVADNYSDLSWTFSVYHKNNASSYNRSYGNNYSFTADGSSRSASYTAGTVSVSGHGSESNALVLSSGSFRVYHGSDGTKTFSFTANYWNTESSSIGSSSHPLSVSGTFTCTTIPRTSSVSASNTYLGTATTISISRASSSFTHDLTYSFGNTSGTIATNVATSYSWTPPLGLASNLSNAASGTCTITCKTKNGSTVIGTKTTTITLTIPASTLAAVSGTMGTAQTLSLSRAASNLTHTITYAFGSASGTITTKTTATSVSWTPAIATFAPQVTNAKSKTGTLTITTYNGTATVGSKTANLTLTVPSSAGPSLTVSTAPSGNFSSYGVYVQGQKCRITFSDSAQYGASISKRTVNGNTVSGTYYDASLSNSGSVTFTCVSTDSRGYTVSKTTTAITVQPYTTPSIPNNYNITRCLQDGTEDDSGTYIKVLCNESHASVSGYNSVTMKVAYGQTGTSYGADQTITPGVAAIIGNGQIAVTDSYDVRVVLTDTAGNTYTLHVVVPAESVTVHLRAGGKGVGVGTYTQGDNEFRVNSDWTASFGFFEGLWQPQVIGSNDSIYAHVRTLGRNQVACYSVQNASDNPHGVGLVGYVLAGSPANNGNYAVCISWSGGEVYVTDQLAPNDTRLNWRRVNGYRSISLTRQNVPSGMSDWTHARRMGNVVIVNFSGAIAGGIADRSTLATGLPTAEGEAYGVIRNASTNAAYAFGIGTGGTSLLAYSAMPSGNAYYIGQLVYFTGDL